MPSARDALLASLTIDVLKKWKSQSGSPVGKLRKVSRELSHQIMQVGAVKSTIELRCDMGDAAGVARAKFSGVKRGTTDLDMDLVERLRFCVDIVDYW